MATLVKLEDQLKQKVKGDVIMKKNTVKSNEKSSKPKTHTVVLGKSTARVGTKKDKGPSKMDCSREVYNRMLNEPRKDVILAFINECKLTVAGANTYYSIHKKSAEE